MCNTDPGHLISFPFSLLAFSFSLCNFYKKGKKRHAMKTKTPLITCRCNQWKWLVSSDFIFIWHSELNIGGRRWMWWILLVVQPVSGFSEPRRASEHLGMLMMSGTVVRNVGHSVCIISLLVAAAASVLMRHWINDLDGTERVACSWRQEVIAPFTWLIV